MNVHHLKESEDNNPENLTALCVACHAILHVGRSLSLGTLEIWKADLSQVEIVRQTREGIRDGKSLQKIKESFSLQRGKYPPTSANYANDLLRKMGKEPRAYLDEPLCAIFVNFNRWQIDEM
jgi:hypothetical protein